MKRCSKCNRTYTTEGQKFCTQDGQLLVDFESARAETVRIDSPAADAPTRTISRELPAEPFDPYKTSVGRPQPTVPTPRVTQDLPAPTSERLISEETITSAPLATSASLPTMASIPTPQPPPPPQTSAPLPPADRARTSGTLPLTTSGPIGTSASLPQPAVSQPLPPRAMTARPGKKSKLPLVLGILAVLLVLGIGVAATAYFVVFRPMLAKRSVTPAPVETPRRRAPEPAPIAEEAPPVQSTAGPEQAPFVAPPNSVEFVNTRDDLDGKLAEHFVDFSFYYPKDWIKDPTAGVRGARNFAKVERRLPPDFTQENFAVGLYASTGAETRDREAYPRLMEARSAEFAKTVPEYQKVSQSETKVGVYNGYELRFSGVSRNTAKGDIKIWGRVVFLPPPDGGKNGVTLLMLATSLAPELKSVADVGDKGELPIILNSFRFGKK